MNEEKQNLSLNCIEQIAYGGLKALFVCGFMIKELVDFGSQEE